MALPGPDTGLTFPALALSVLDYPLDLQAPFLDGRDHGLIVFLVQPETDMLFRIVGLEGEPVLLPFHEESDETCRTQEQGRTCTGLPAAMLGPGVGDGLDLRVGQFLESLCCFPVSDLDGLLGQNQVTLDLLHLVPDRDQILDLAERDGLGWDGQGHGQDDGDEGIGLRFSWGVPPLRAMTFPRPERESGLVITTQQSWRKSRLFVQGVPGATRIPCNCGLFYSAGSPTQDPLSVMTGKMVGDCREASRLEWRRRRDSNPQTLYSGSQFSRLVCMPVPPLRYGVDVPPGPGTVTAAACAKHSS